VAFCASERGKMRPVRIAYRLALALGSAATLVIAGSGISQLNAEREELRAVAVSETTLLAQSIRRGFAHALRDRQEGDVNELLHSLSRIQPLVNIFVFDRQGRLIDSSSDTEVTSDVTALTERVRGTREPVVESVSTPTVPVLRVAVSIDPTVPESKAALVVERPLVEMQHALDAARRNTIGAIVVTIVLVALGLIALTRLYVGRPLERLIAHMERIRTGDWSDPSPEIMRADEVGALLEEFATLTEELKLARHQLENEEESRRRMQRTLQELDKLATLGQLSAAVAHEIGSPLQILEGRARALAKNPDDPETTRRISEIALEQVGRITRIVSQLLTMTRRRSPARREVDPVGPVRSVLELLELEARRRSVSLSLIDDGAPPTALLNGDQLQQVVLNLVSNALDAVPAGGHVWVRLSQGVVHRAEASASIPTFRLIVKDDGPGIAESERAQLFEPFFTTKAEHGGTGLGLAVVKAIVEDHRGKVEVSSFPGGGTEFVVDFPISAARLPFGSPSAEEFEDGEA
jgi:signal transduction histidine kinase